MEKIKKILAFAVLAVFVLGLKAVPAYAAEETVVFSAFEQRHHQGNDRDAGYRVELSRLQSQRRALERDLAQLRREEARLNRVPHDRHVKAEKKRIAREIKEKERKLKEIKREEDRLNRQHKRW